jgi:mRNA interferase MazF
MKAGVKALRGDLVTVALHGQQGKPRPALVIQTDVYDEHPWVTVLPVTSDFKDASLFRVPIEPTPATGLKKSSQVMVDKTQTVARERICGVIGHVDDDTLLAVNRALAVFLGFA